MLFLEASNPGKVVHIRGSTVLIERLQTRWSGAVGGVKLTTYVHLVSRLRMSGTIPPSPDVSLWHAHVQCVL